MTSGISSPVATKVLYSGIAATGMGGAPHSLSKNSLKTDSALLFIGLVIAKVPGREQFHR